MNIEIYKVGSSLDSSSSKDEQQYILTILDKKKNVILDMSECKYVSSAGLRVMLYTYKVAVSYELKIYLVGVCPEVKDVMNITGFKHFFQYFDTVDDCKNQVICKE